MAIPSPKNYNVDNYNMAKAQRDALMEELHSLLYDKTPNVGGKAGGGAHIASPSDVVVGQTRATPTTPGTTTPLVDTTTADTKARRIELQNTIRNLDHKLANPEVNFRLEAGSPEKKAYTMMGAPDFSMDPTLRGFRNNAPMLSALLGTADDTTGGNMLSRIVNSFTNPDLAQRQYVMANAGNTTAGDRTLSTALGGGSYDALKTTTADDLYELGKRSGFILDTDPPEIVQTKLSQIASEVSTGQRATARKFGEAAGSAADRVELNKQVVKTGGKTALGGGVAYGAYKLGELGVGKLADYMDTKATSAAALKAKAEKLKEKEKRLAKFSGRFFPAMTEGMPGLKGANTGSLDEKSMRLWDEDVDNLMATNRTRMYAGLPAASLAAAQRAVAAMEDQFGPALRAMGMGQADVSDYPELENSLKQIGSDYGIDYAKTPYFYGSSKDGANGEEFETGLMIAGEDEPDATGAPVRRLKRFGITRGKNTVTDFIREEEARAGE